MSPLKDLVGQDINTVIIGIVSALVVASLPKILDLVFSRRPRLVYWQTKPSYVDLNAQFVQTETLFIQNVGGQEAQDVRVIHNWQRDTFKAVVQPLEYSEEQTPRGQVVFRLPTIHQGEMCVITYVHSTPPSQDPLLNSIRVNDHIARPVSAPTASRYPKWAIWFYKVLAFIGAWLALYIIIRVLILVWQILF